MPFPALPPRLQRIAPALLLAVAGGTLARQLQIPLPWQRGAGTALPLAARQPQR